MPYCVMQNVFRAWILGRKVFFFLFLFFWGFPFLFVLILTKIEEKFFLEKVREMFMLNNPSMFLSNMKHENKIAEWNKNREYTSSHYCQELSLLKATAIWASKHSVSLLKGEVILRDQTLNSVFLFFWRVHSTFTERSILKSHGYPKRS